MSLRSSLPSRSMSQKPLRNAATKPPALRKVKEPIDSGICHAVLMAVAGSKRLRLGALMSTQYSD